MAETAREADKLKVFISYSRDDLHFADQLDVALDAANNNAEFDAVLDRHGISGAEDWKRRLGELIRDADTVVFVLSPSSVSSDICRWEVEEAARLAKRIIPVLCRPLEDARPPQQLADLNYIYFYDEPKSPGSGFGAGLVRLIQALNEDPAWLREHTRLLGLATQWDAAGRPASRLLSGDDIARAKAWLIERRQTKTEPTALHLEFIRASEEEADSRLAVERQRLAEMLAAQEERGKALAAAERAQVEREAAVRARARLRAFAFTALAVVAGLAGWQWWEARTKHLEALSMAKREEKQRLEATLHKDRAEAASKRAEAEAARAEAAAREVLKSADNVLLSQSQYLARLALTDFTMPGAISPELAALYAIEALPDEKSDPPRIRPVWPPANAALENALRHLRRSTILSGHLEAVTEVVVVPDGRLASGSADNTIRLWDPSGKAAPLVLGAHKDRVTTLAVIPDGRLASGSDDNTIRIWDVRGGSLAIVLQGHKRRVAALAVFPDGRLVSASDDSTIRVWDVRGSGAAIVLEGHKDRVTAILVLPDGRLASASVDGSVRVWDTRDGSVHIVHEDHKRTITTLAVLHDGRLVSGSTDGTIRILDLRSGHPGVVLQGHKGTVNSLVSLPDDRLASASDDGSIRLWDVRDGSGLAVLDGHKDRVTTSAILPDGRLASGSADGSIHLWDMHGSEQPVVLEGHKGRVWSLAVLPDGRLVSGSEDNTIRMWDVRGGSSPFVLKGHKTRVTALAAMADGRLASGSDDSTIRVWDADDGTSPILLEGHKDRVTTLAVLPDGRLASGAADGTIHLWNVRGNRAPVALEGHRNAITALTMFADGRLASASADGTIRLWDVSGRRAPIVLTELKGAITTLAILDQGRVASGLTDGTIRLWNGQDSRTPAVLEGHKGEITTLAALSEGRLASASVDGTTRLWNVRDGSALDVIKELKRTVTALAVLPDGRLASGSRDGVIRLWDGRVGAPIVFERQKVPLTALLALPDGRLASAFDDGTIRLWTKLPRGQALVDYAKGQVARCLSREERRDVSLPEEPPPWCVAAGMHPFDATNLAVTAMSTRRLSDFDAAISDAQRLGRMDVLKEAVDKFEHIMLERAQTLARDLRIDEAISFVDSSLPFASRLELVRRDRFRAELIFVRAQMREALGQSDLGRADFVAAARGGIDVAAWLIERGIALEANEKFDEAVASIDDALLYSSLQPKVKHSLGSVYGGKGEILRRAGKPLGAIAAFEMALSHGAMDAHIGILASRLSLAQALRDDGRPAEALIRATNALLDLPESQRNTVARTDLVSNLTSLTYPLSLILSNDRSTQEMASDCDRLAAFSYDPYRQSGGVLYEDLRAQDALVHCTRSLANNPRNPRLLLQHARALSKLGDDAAKVSNLDAAKKHFADMVSDLEAAMSIGYPSAFNNMALNYEAGRGVETNRKRAGELHLESFNRTLLCCLTHVARKVMAERDKLATAGISAADTDRAVHALLAWAVELGDAASRSYLEELYVVGTLARSTGPPRDPAVPPLPPTADPPWTRGKAD